jgi:hypothetical protein
VFQHTNRRRGRQTDVTIQIGAIFQLFVGKAPRSRFCSVRGASCVVTRRCVKLFWAGLNQTHYDVPMAWFGNNKRSLYASLVQNFAVAFPPHLAIYLRHRFLSLTPISASQVFIIQGSCRPAHMSLCYTGRVCSPPPIVQGYS